jgi:hypothetical protein
MIDCGFQHTNSTIARDHRLPEIHLDPPGAPRHSNKIAPNPSRNPFLKTPVRMTSRTGPVEYQPKPGTNVEKMTWVAI